MLDETQIYIDPDDYINLLFDKQQNAAIEVWGVKGIPITRELLGRLQNEIIPMLLDHRLALKKQQARILRLESELKSMGKHGH